ncbi:gamma-glutamyl-gamma-aminobutyrate hydrolase family protein [Trebonia sp.]|uniref:gamma-glutamyl-gamma-aminobutyrate hydrolase family protein n=1 Tax=Trebonia sp. TaxID=2767075 RepID=UPI00263A1041|nr:gamma-glutamyl-gamma-aminobutyrate hydrolase family protein [Trebonia sp.]
MAPTIGITTYHTSANWRGWSEDGALLPWRYVTAIRNGGGRPVLLPPGGDAAEAEATVAVLDGVVIAGGADIDPAIYGASRHPKTAVTAPDRDRWELAIAEAAIRMRVPLLGICRGMQVLNVACGGTLVQHVPDLVGHEAHSGTTEGFGTHKVRVTSGRTVAGILPGAEYFEVPTHHHQAVDKLGDGLTAVAWADDGIIEAVEAATPDGFIVGVQWHPEQGEDMRLFAALVAAAEMYASEQAVQSFPPLLAGA